MGVYKQLESVPEEYRLRQYASEYEGRDVWAEYAETRSDEYESSHYWASVRKAGESWKAHVEGRGRHHALARPGDVETWCAGLAETRTLRTVYTEYWVRLEEFYSWLQFHTDHPHVYQPVIMAAAEYPTAAAIWEQKIGEWSERGGTRE
ncbi:hypothetical protein ACFQH6_19775 [Halobacteriaceae archaeon GCM10025711]